MKRFIFFAIVVMFIFLLSVASVTTRYELGDKYGTLYYFETIEYDTSFADTFTSQTFDMAGYPYQSIQIRLTTSTDTVVVKYQCSPWDSSTYWSSADWESVGVIATTTTDTTVSTWGNFDLGTPLTRYLKYKLIAKGDSVDLNVFFNFWRQ